MPTRDRNQIIRQRKAVWRMAGIAAIIFAFTLLGRIMHDQKEAEAALIEGEPELRPVKGPRELTAGHVDETPIAAPGNEIWIAIEVENETQPEPEPEGEAPTDDAPTQVTAEGALVAAKSELRTCLDRWWMLSPTVPSPIQIALEFDEAKQVRLGLTGVSGLPEMISSCVSAAAAAHSAGDREAGLAQVDLTVPSGE